MISDASDATRRPLPPGEWKAPGTLPYRAGGGWSASCSECSKPARGKSLRALQS